MRTLTIQPNKNGQKRIRIGNFIIRFDKTSPTGRQSLAILKYAIGTPNLEASGKDEKSIRDWMIHIYETDDDDDKTLDT